MFFPLLNELSLIPCRAAEAKTISATIKRVATNQNLPALLKSLDDAYKKIEASAGSGNDKVVFYPTQGVKDDLKIALQGLGFIVVNETGGELTVSW